MFQFEFGTFIYFDLGLLGTADDWRIAGFVGYIFASLTLEDRDTATEPILSYGQQAGLISLPMCTLICAANRTWLAFTIADNT